MYDGMKRWGLAILLSVCLVGVAFAQQANKPDAFSEATIRVKGFGRMPPGQAVTRVAKLKAARAAKIDAMRNVAMLFKDMEIRGDERVKTIVVKGLVSGAREVGQPVVKDGWVVVTVEVPLSSIAGNMAGLEAKVAQAQDRNKQLQQALGRADASLARMRETLDKLKTAVENMDKRLKEKGK